MWSTTTFTPFFWPHSGQYFLSNHSSNAGTKCVHWPILSVSDFAWIVRVNTVGLAAAAATTPAAFKNPRRLMDESAMLLVLLSARVGPAQRELTAPTILHRSASDVLTWD